MPRYASGGPVRVSTEVRDTTGSLTTPGSILLRVKRPDGTFIPDYTSPPADGTGLYHQDLPAADLSQLGHYQYAWITTGTASGVSPAAAFEVVDPFAATHITWADVLERLELTGATLSASKQAELQSMMASAVSEQEQRVGPVAPRTVTETAEWSGGQLLLRTRPVLTLQSATLGGVAVSTSTWSVSASGMVDRGAGYPAYGGYGTGYGYPYAQRYVVTFTAGRNPVPQDLVEAALLRVEHSYATQRGGAGGGQIIGSASSDAEGGGGSDFLLLLRARDKEAPYVIRDI